MSIYAILVESRYKIINKETPQERRQYACLRATPWYSSPHEWPFKFHRAHAALQGSTNTLDTGVAKPMSEKSSTHGVRKGVVKPPSMSIKIPRTLSASQASFQLEPRDDERMFPQI